jgi:dATP pyrophosphohydrolase
MTHVEIYLFRRRPALRILLLRRAAGRRTLPGVWQPVTGKIRRGERALAAAAREVREETGLEPRRWWALETTSIYFDPIDDCVRVLPLFAAEVTPGARIELSREHDAFRFLEPSRAAARVLWDTQRVGLDALRSQVLARPSLAAALELTSHAPRRTRTAARP